MPTKAHLLAIVQCLSICTIIVASNCEDPQQAFVSHRQAEYPHYSPNSDQEALFDAFPYAASTDESKLKLAFLVDDKIDKNKDSMVQLDELVNWLRESQNKYAEQDVNRNWVSFGKNTNDDGSTLKWDEYNKKEYDHLLSLINYSSDPKQVEQIKASYGTLMLKDLKRWKLADINQDGVLSKDEFKYFLYPEHSERMYKLLVEEKFELIDKNKDGRISIDEYLADLAVGEAHLDSKRQEELIKKERLKFINNLDVNHDKYLDKSELASYISQSELHDHSIAEAQHLMKSADSNKDHRLTKEEVLAAYHDFANSHATDFGEALKSQERALHDEL